VESPQPFTAVPASWTPINGGEALAVGGNGSYIAVTNRADKSDGVALGVTGMQVDIFYKVRAASRLFHRGCLQGLEIKNQEMKQISLFLERCRSQPG
jgi:hypothetical protein